MKVGYCPRCARTVHISQEDELEADEPTCPVCSSKLRNVRNLKKLPDQRGISG